MNEELRNEIVQRWRGGQSQRGIARDLTASRWTVARVIVQHQTQRGETSPPAAGTRCCVTACSNCVLDEDVASWSDLRRRRARKLRWTIRSMRSTLRTKARGA